MHDGHCQPTSPSSVSSVAALSPPWALVLVPPLPLRGLVLLSQPSSSLVRSTTTAAPPFLPCTDEEDEGRCLLRPGRELADDDENVFAAFGPPLSLLESALLLSAMVGACGGTAELTDPSRWHQLSSRRRRSAAAAAASLGLMWRQLGAEDTALFVVPPPPKR